jgi:catechol 2,3-dioxygenase-like lactoylglutathione lyase family enzyme
MAILDHLIVPVTDAETSARFYADVSGFEPEGLDGPFTVVRVISGTVLLAPWTISAPAAWAPRCTCSIRTNT